MLHVVIIWCWSSVCARYAAHCRRGSSRLVSSADSAPDSPAWPLRPPPPASCSNVHLNNTTQRGIYSLINPLGCFFSNEGHVILDRNQRLGYNTQLLIPRDLLSACLYR